MLIDLRLGKGRYPFDNSPSPSLKKKTISETAHAYLEPRKRMYMHDHQLSSCNLIQLSVAVKFYTFKNPISNFCESCGAYGILYKLHMEGEKKSTKLATRIPFKGIIGM